MRTTAGCVMGITLMLTSSLHHENGKNIPPISRVEESFFETEIESLPGDKETTRRENDKSIARCIKSSYEVVEKIREENRLLEVPDDFVLAGEDNTLLYLSPNAYAYFISVRCIRSLGKSKPRFHPAPLAIQQQIKT